MFTKRLLTSLAATAALCLGAMGVAEAQIYGSRPGITYNSAAQVITGLIPFASLPGASAYQGWVAYTSDQGEVISNGVTWSPLGFYPEFNLTQWSVPVIMPSSGSIANNGVLTITTALPATYGNLYLYLPAGAIAAAGPGSAAGVYYAQCTTTTACTVFNNVLNSGPPQIIVAPTAFVSTGPGAYTQTTGTFVNLMTITVGAGFIGANGVLSASTYALRPNTAGAVQEQWTLGGSAVGILNAASVIWYPMSRQIRNQASQAIQVLYPNATSSTNDQSTLATAPTILAVNTALSQNFIVQGQLAAATDYLDLIGGLLQIEYAP